MAEQETITINGERLPLRVSDVAELLVHLGYGADPAGLAVARNGRVVPRSRWREERIADGDTLEIVGAVQGG